uniref:Zinc finger-homeodomain protein 1 n=1 Tax=Asparagus officinalis TaxID=4686 RepID=B0LK18_ASPOF|nr:zinc finger-homeodomain protein 1 [Asparagus officinalis]
MDLSSHEGDIPIPISSSTYIGAQSHGHSFLSSSNGPPPHHHHHHHPPPPPPTEDHHHQAIVPKKPAAVVKYRECLKNHAASIGGNATDGCGEFMPSGEEGTLEALKCSACGCHRNFHRKETEGDPFGGNPSCDCRRNFIGGHGHKGVLIPRPTPHSMIMPLGAASAMQTSESDEMMPRPPLMKKRFRTKFSAEQKEKMLAFAERAGWKLQKQEEGVVQRFCQEIGVKRRVLKVWMHNNKHNLAKKEPLANNSSFNNSERVSSFNSERVGERMSE